MGTSGVVDAATSGGDALMVFSLAVAGALIALLLGLVAWFTKDRVNSRKRYEELLEKRLSAGADTMQNLKVAVEKIQTKFVEAIGALLSEEKFDGYCKEHRAEHDRLEERIAILRESHAELKQDIRAVGTQVDASMKSVSGLLSKIVKVEPSSAPAPTGE